MTSYTKNLAVTAFYIGLLCTPFALARAETVATPPVTPSSKDLMPPASGQTSGTDTLEGETHPVLNLSPDKSELVPLDREAHSVVIGNSAHIGVLLDTPKLAVVIPRSAGATYFTILDKDGKVVMQRHVVVAAPKKNYVRIRRSCGTVPDGTACKSTSVYFCPDMCHEIGDNGAGGSGGSGSSATSSPSVGVE